MKPAGKSRSCFSAQPCRKDEKHFQMMVLKNYGEKEKIFLEKNKVDEIIKRAVLEVLNHKPANPYKFLANHFEWEFSRSNHTKKAHQLIVSANSRSHSFEDAIQQAFIVLRQSKVRDGVKGINGDIYMDLLQAICSDILCESEEYQLLENVFVPSGVVVSFRAFRAGVHYCFLYRDFLRSVKALAAALDPEETGTVPASLAELLLKEMASVDEGGDASAAAKSESRQVAPASTRPQEPIRDVRQSVKPSIKPRCRSTDGNVLIGEFAAHAMDLFWDEMMSHCFYS